MSIKGDVKTLGRDQKLSALYFFIAAFLAAQLFAPKILYSQEAPAEETLVVEEQEALDEDVYTEEELRAIADPKAKVIFQYYLEGGFSAEPNKQNLPSHENFELLVQQYKERFIDAGYEASSEEEVETLAREYLRYVWLTFLVYERWWNYQDLAFEDLPRFRVFDDPSLLTGLGVVDPRGANFRFLLLEIVPEEPAGSLQDFLAHARRVMGSETQAGYGALLKDIFNDAEDQDFDQRAFVIPEVRDGYFIGLEGLETFDAILNFYYFHRQALSLSRGDLAVLEESVRSQMVNRSFIGVQLADITEVLRQVVYRKTQKTRYSSLKTQPDRYENFQKSDLYYGKTIAHQLEVWSRLLKIDDYDSELDAQSYLRFIISEKEYETKNARIYEGVGEANSPRRTKNADIAGLDTKLGRVRFLLAAMLANKELSNSRNLIQPEKAFLLNYSLDDLLRLHYIRSRITEFPLRKEVVEVVEADDSVQVEYIEYSTDEILKITENLKTFSAFLADAFEKPPYIVFKTYNQFQNEGREIYRLLLRVMNRAPGIPMEILGLGRSYQRTKKFFDRGPLSIYEYLNQASKDENVRSLIPLPDYHYISLEQLRRDVIELDIEIGTRMQRLVNAIDLSLSVGLSAEFELLNKDILDEKNLIQERLETLQAAEEPDAQAISLAELRLEEIEADYQRARAAIDEVRAYDFSGWTLTQLEALHFLVAPNGIRDSRFKWFEEIELTEETSEGPLRMNLFDFVYGFEAADMGDTAELLFLAQRLATEEAIFSRLYGKPIDEVIKDSLYEDRGRAIYLLETASNRGRVAGAILRHQIFSHHFSTGGHARSDGLGIRFYTPIGLRWADRRTIDLIRLLNQEDIPTDEEHLDNLLADGGEFVARLSTLSIAMREGASIEDYDLGKAIEAEISGYFEILGGDVFELLGARKTQKEWLHDLSLRMAKAIREDGWDYNSFFSQFGELLLLRLQLSFEEELDEETTLSLRARMQEISNELLLLLLRSPEFETEEESRTQDPVQILRQFIFFINSEEAYRVSVSIRRESKTRVVWKNGRQYTVQDTGGASDAVEREFVETIPFDFSAHFREHASASDFYSAIEDQDLSEQLKAVYQRVQADRYTTDEGEFVISGRVRRELNSGRTMKLERFELMSLPEESDREVDESSRLDLHKLDDREKMALAQITFEAQTRMANLLLQRTITYESFIRFIFAQPDSLRSSSDYELDDGAELLRDWFFMSEETGGNKKIKGDSKNLSLRLLRFLGLVSAPGRSQNFALDLRMIEAFNRDEWEQIRWWTRVAAEYFFEGGREIYESLESSAPPPLTRQHIGIILERIEENAKFKDLVLVPEDKVFSIGELVDSSEAEEILTDAGLAGVWERTSDKKALKRQLGSLRKIISVAKALFEERDNGVRLTEILAQIAAPIYLEEIILGKGTDVPIEYRYQIEELDEDADVREAQLAETLPTPAAIIRRRLEELNRLFELRFGDRLSADLIEAASLSLWANISVGLLDEEDFYRRFEVWVRKKAELSPPGFFSELGHTLRGPDIMQRLRDLDDPAIDDFVDFLQEDRRRYEIVDSNATSPATDRRVGTQYRKRVKLPGEDKKDLLELYLDRAFPDMELEQEWRIRRASAVLHFNRDYREVIDMRSENYRSFLVEMRPELDALLPEESKFADIFYSRFVSGELNLDEFLDAWRLVVSNHLQLAHLLRYSDSEPVFFAESLMRLTTSINATLEEDVALLQLFEEVSAPVSEASDAFVKKPQVKAEKMDLARDLLTRFYMKKAKAQADKIELLVSPAVFAELKLAESLSVWAESLQVKEEDLLSESELEGSAPSFLLPQYFNEHLNGLYLRGFTPVEFQRTQAEEIRDLALAHWIKIRVNEINVPWFSGQEGIDPPYMYPPMEYGRKTSEQTGLAYGHQRLMQFVLDPKGPVIYGDADLYPEEAVIREVYGHDVSGFKRRISDEEFAGIYSQARRFTNEVRELHELASSQSEDSDEVYFSYDEIRSYIHRVNIRALNNWLVLSEAARVRDDDTEEAYNARMEAAEKSLKGVWLLRYALDFSREIAFEVLVNDEAEEFFDTNVQSSDPKTHRRLTKRDFFKVTSWAMAQVYKKDGDRNEFGLQAAALTNSEAELTAEVIKDTLEAAGVENFEEISQRQGMRDEMLFIRELLTRNYELSESSVVRRQLMGARDAVAEGTRVMQRNLFFSQKLATENQEIEKAKAVVDELKELMEIEQVYGIPFSRLTKAMRVSGEAQARYAMSLNQDLFDALEARENFFLWKFGVGVYTQLEAFTIGAALAVAETGFWVVETPAVIFNYYSNPDEFGEWIQDWAVWEADRDELKWWMPKNARYHLSGWKQEYVEEEGFGYWLSHQVINAASVAFIAAKVAKPASGLVRQKPGLRILNHLDDQSVANMQRLAVRDGLRENVERGVRENFKKLPRAQQTPLLQSVAQGGKLPWWRSPIYIFGRSPNYPVNSMLTSVSRARGAAGTAVEQGNLAGKFFKGLGWRASQAAVNGLGLTLGMLLPTYFIMREPGQDLGEFISTHGSTIGEGVGMIAALMMIHGGLGRVGMKGGAFRTAAYLNKGISLSLTYYILRETFRSAIQVSDIAWDLEPMTRYLYGNEWVGGSDWNREWLYDDLPRDDDGRIIFSEDDGEAEAQWSKHRERKAYFASHVVLMGWLVATPLISKRLSNRFRMNGQLSQAKAIEEIFPFLRTQTYDDVVGIWRDLYIHGVERSASYARVRGETPSVERMGEIQSGQLVELRNRIIDSGQLRQDLNMFLGRKALNSEYQQVEQMFRRSFQEGISQGEATGWGFRREHTRLEEYADGQGYVDVLRWSQETGIREWMEKAADLFPLNPEARTPEQMAAFYRAIDGRAQSFLDSGLMRFATLREASHLRDVVVRRLKDLEAGEKYVENRVGDMDVISFWPSMEAHAAFWNRVLELRGAEPIYESARNNVDALLRVSGKAGSILDIPGAGRSRLGPLELQAQRVLDAQSRTVWWLYSHEVPGQRIGTYYHPIRENGQARLDIASMRASFRWKRGQTDSEFFGDGQIGFRSRVERPDGRIQDIRAELYPSESLQDASVVILHFRGGREVQRTLFESLERAELALKDMGVEVKGMNAGSAPAHEPDVRVNTNGVVRSFEREAGPALEPGISRQMWQIQYKRLGRKVTGWARSEMLGGTMVTTFPDGSQIYFVRGGSRAPFRGSSPDEVSNVRRLVEGPAHNDMAVNSQTRDVTTPRTAAEAIANNVKPDSLTRSEAESSIPPSSEGVLYRLKMPPPRLGELRSVDPATGNIHLIDRNGIETIVQPRNDLIEMYFHGTNTKVFSGSIRLQSLVDMSDFLLTSRSTASEAMLAFMMRNWGTRSEAAQTKNPLEQSMTVQEMHRNQFGLDTMLHNLGIHNQSGFKHYSTERQLSTIASQRDQVIRRWEGSSDPTGFVRVYEAQQAFTNLEAYIRWLSQKPKKRSWAKGAGED